MRLPRGPLLISGGALLAFLTISLALAWWASQQSPRFYRQALARSSSAPTDAGQRFESALLQLHNQPQHTGRWEITLDENEINGWLAHDLPLKFSSALPPGISEPRLAIGDDRLQLAVHYQRGAVDTVISISGDLYLTDHSNEIAFRLDSARAGLLPIPLDRYLSEITKRAAKANVPLRWTEVRGAPVALVRLPLSTTENHLMAVLDDLRTTSGQIHLSGHTAPASSKSTIATQPGESPIRQR